MQETKASKLITCIVPSGRALPVLKALKQEHDVVTANIHHARGSGRMTPMAWRGLGETTEKDIMDVIVSIEQAADVFAFIYEQAEINQPHGGIIYQRSLSRATSFSLPDIEEEALD